MGILKIAIELVFNGYLEDWRKIMKLENIKTEDDLEKYDDYLNELENDGKITNDENYELYNKAFEKVYSHSAFDDNDNFN